MLKFLFQKRTYSLSKQSQKVYIFMLYVTFYISVTRLVSNYGVDDEEGEDDMSISSAEEAEDDELSYSTEKVIMNYHIQQKK